MEVKRVALSLLLCTLVAADPPLVETKFGKVSGRRETFQGSDVNAFIGIPYATPPLGDLRFKRPAPFDKPWQGIREASTEPKACHQPQMPGFKLETDEDCLYLSVWSPQTTCTGLKPVLVMIHGGGFSVGSGNSMGLSGLPLASVGDVVYVSINYRLGALGFLYGGRDSIPGNVGLWDQRLALQWVNDNIASFGGDPDAITLLGVSAGAMSIGVHLLSPGSWPLFNHAIMASGSPISFVSYESATSALQKAKRFAKSVSCTTEDIQGDRLPDDVVECLMKMDVAKLVTSMTIETIGKPTFEAVDMWAKPLFGDNFLPDHPAKLVSGGKFKRTGSAMVSSNQDEGSLIQFLMEINKIEYNANSTDKGQWAELAFDILDSGPTSTKYYLDDFRRLYFDTSPSDLNSLKAAFRQLFGDYALLCPAYLLGEEMAKYGKTVYAYYFDYKAKATLYCPADAGSCHGEDASYIYGKAFRGQSDPTDLERETSLTIMKFVTKFAKNGKPGDLSDGTPWPPYVTTTSGQVVPVQRIIDPNSKQKLIYGVSYGKCLYWKPYIMT